LREIYKKTLSNLRRDWMLKEFGRIFFLRPGFYRLIFKVLAKRLE
jgi:hypothetical protein